MRPMSGIICPDCGETNSIYLAVDEAGCTCKVCDLRFAPGAQQVLRIEGSGGEVIRLPVERVETVVGPCGNHWTSIEGTLPVDRLDDLRKIQPHALPKIQPLLRAILSSPAGTKTIPPSVVIPAGREPVQKDTASQQGTVGETGNFLRLEKGAWRISYDGSEATFQHRADSVLRHLARLLAEPNRRFSAVDFYPPPAGEAPMQYMGRDESSDSQAMQEYKKELSRLVQEIKAATDAHDAETAEELRKQFNELSKHVKAEKSARKRGHKKRCGIPSPIEKASQALRVGLSRLYKRFRKNDLEKLAEHLEKHICNDEDGKWFYAPTPETPPWQVTRPENYNDPLRS
jgi:hypothetical protein